MNRYLAYCLVLLSVLSLAVHADAYTIKQGAIPIGVSAYNETRNFEHGSNVREQYLSVNGGYFLKDNIEIGTGLSNDHYYSSSQRRTSWSLSPYVRFHMPLDERSNVYAGAGIFFTTMDIDSGSGRNNSQDSSGITLGVGWEYFFNANVALTVGLSYSRVEWNLHGYSRSSDKEDRFYWPQIGFRVYLQ